MRKGIPRRAKAAATARIRIGLAGLNSGSYSDLGLAYPGLKAGVVRRELSDSQSSDQPSQETFSTISTSGKKYAASIRPFSTESDPWTMFSPLLSANSFLMVPSAASAGSVAPMSFR